MLFRLNTIRAVVLDIPMDAKYAGEVSNLRISKIIGEFLYKHLRNFGKRIFYNYFLRDFSMATLELVSGTALALFGLIFGAYHWMLSVQQGIPATTGTVMVAALPFLLGMQYLLAFLAYDTTAIPREALHPRLPASDS